MPKRESFSLQHKLDVVKHLAQTGELVAKRQTVLLGAIHELPQWGAQKGSLVWDTAASPLSHEAEIVSCGDETIRAGFRRAGRAEKVVDDELVATRACVPRERRC